MSRVTLISTITDRADETFWLHINSETFRYWIDHWIKTGEEFYRELLAEGLTETAAHVKDVVDYHRKMGYGSN